MRYILNALLILLFTFSLSIEVFPLHSQDSLELSINSIKDPNDRLYSIEEQLPDYIRHREAEAKSFLFKEGFDLANEINSDTSLAFLNLQKGTDEYFYGNFIQSKEYYQLSIDIYYSIPDEIKTTRVRRNEAHAYNNLAIINKKQGLYSKSLMNFQIALSIRKGISDSIQIANTYLNIGNLYNRQKKIFKSKEYYLNARSIYLNIGDDYGLASVNHNLGIVHELLEEYEESLEAFRQSYAIYLRLDRKETMAKSLNNMGNAFLNLNEKDSVLPYLDKAFLLYSELQDTIGLCSVYMNYGNYYSQIASNEKTESYLNKALNISRAQSLADKEVNIIIVLSNHYYNKGDYKKAFNYLSLADSLQNEFMSDMDEIRFQQLDEYYTDETTKQNIAIKELELQNSKNTLKNNQIFSLVLIVSLIIIVVLLVSIYKRYNTTNSIKLELENTNKQLQQINKDYRKTLISKEEKEILLQEVHHRVKNNLQIINSLLRFQAMKGNDETKELILELQTRITAMSLLHEQLYMTKDFTQINVKDYIDLLLSNLSSVYSHSFPINIHQDIDINYLDLDTLHPLGLLITEIISNSLKHAFNEDIDSCDVYINLYGKDGECHLETGDNGIGFNRDSAMSNRSNLGVELISSLISQLEGETHTTDDKGTHYNIVFPSSKVA